jgi:GDPmannose 4,6-dehydratase
MSKKKALIYGITGQCGSYLTELLLEKNYEVHGIIRRSSTINTPRIDHLMNDIKTYYGDVTDAASVNAIINDIKPCEIYNLAAQSHVKVSFEMPSYTAQVDALGTLNILEACRQFSKNTKLYQASTSELYGGMGFNMPPGGYTETSQMYPRSPYGVAKLFGFWIVKNYREAYNSFACNGILFNNESPRRGETFVTRKITIWLAKNYKNIKNNNQVIPLELGNLNASRDWGHSKDYVNAMHLILQQNEPDDYVISTGETHTVKEFITESFKLLNLNVEWHGYGVNEVGTCNGITVVKINPKYFRPSEVEYLLGNCIKAKIRLNWIPQYSFKELVEDMVLSDIKKEENGK